MQISECNANTTMDDITRESLIWGLFDITITIKKKKNHYKNRKVRTKTIKIKSLSERCYPVDER